MLKVGTKQVKTRSKDNSTNWLFINCKPRKILQTCYSNNNNNNIKYYKRKIQFPLRLNLRRNNEILPWILIKVQAWTCVYKYIWKFEPIVPIYIYIYIYSSDCVCVCDRCDSEGDGIHVWRRPGGAVSCVRRQGLRIPLRSADVRELQGNDHKQPVFNHWRTWAMNLLSQQRNH